MFTALQWNNDMAMFLCKLYNSLDTSYTLTEVIVLYQILSC